MKNILIPLDFSEYSKNAVIEALKVFKEAEYLYFIHVIPANFADIWDFEDEKVLEGIKEKAEKRMRDFIDSMKISDTYKTEYAIIEGNPARTIIELGNSGKFDAIVMGTKGHSEMEGVMVGSVTLKVASSVSIPLMIVKKKV